MGDVLAFNRLLLLPIFFPPLVLYLLLTSRSDREAQGRAVLPQWWEPTEVLATAAAAAAAPLRYYFRHGCGYGYRHRYRYHYHYHYRYQYRYLYRYQYR